MSSPATALELKPEPVKPKNLVQKLCEVMAAVERVEKRGRNEFHKYDYAREADIVEAIRGELASRNLFIFPSVETHTRTAEITDIMVAWTFVDGDSGEERTCRVPGAGQDKGDKGVYKALTGSEKYFLMKAFLIPTGDDPEADSKEERSAAKQGGKATAKALGEAKAKSMAQNGGSQRVTTLFYTWPERNNGDFAEFVNIASYLSSNEDKSESVRKALREAGAVKTKDDTALVASFKVKELLEKLAGDCGVDIHELKAKG